MIKSTKILQGHNSSIYKLFFDEESNELFSVGGDGWLVSWDWQDSLDGQLVAKVEDQIFALAVNSQYFFLGTFSGNLYILDRKSRQEVFAKKIHHKGIYDVVITDEYFYTLGGDGKVRKWKMDTHDFVQEVHLTAKPLRCGKIDTENFQMAIGSSDGNIYILDLHNLYLNKVVNEAHERSVFSLAYISGQLISGGMDALLRVWDSKLWTLQHSLPAHWYTINDIIDLGSVMATASRDKSIRFWSKQDFQPITSIKWGQTTEAHVNSVNSLAYCQKAKVLFSASDDRSIRLWFL
ncbi:WD40 repeat domain-containing protein [Membranihabitans marinus]|uniref:hypothetical protein n=1 Tax=Membranihabitans marinus TaxID=1227546 RepID=UPI001F28AFF9|nr:hypothetical protein [Membranihabitans marinus]